MNIRATVLKVGVAGVVAATALAVTQCAPRSTAAYTLAVLNRSNATPSIAAQGRFLAVAWGASTSNQSDVYASVSRDEGRTFTTPVRVNSVEGEARLNGEQAPRVAVVPAAGSPDPAIVVLWTARGERTEVKSARSLDGGKTFERAISLLANDAAGSRGWPALAIDSGAVAHAVWLDHRDHAHAGQSAGHSGHGSTTERDGVAMAQKSALYYAPADGSRPERKLAAGVCYCCKTALAVGMDGTVFTAWRHVYPGNFRDMAFAVSRDRGASFSEPVRVSEDGWSIDACPDDGPAVVADRTGTAHIVWPTVVSGTKPEGAIFYASTVDGRTFSPRVRVPSLGGSHPRHPQIVLAGDGRLVVAWDEVLNGRRVAAARAVVVKAANQATFGDAAVIDRQDQAVYPVLAGTSSGVAAAWTAGTNPSVVRVRILPVP